MTISRRFRAIRLVLVAVLLAGILSSGGTAALAQPTDALAPPKLTAALAQPTPAAAPEAGSAVLPPWTGGVDLFRPGTFSTQKTWIWCTAASVQIMRNIVHDRSDQTRASQGRYFRYMRTHQRYAIPLAHGVDPTGWAAGLRRWVDPRYRVVAEDRFRRALRSAVTSLRLTNLPVALAVARGAHGWLLTGFTATEDPARTRRFRITSVRVVGPLWRLQSRSFGYDMKPNTRLTSAQLRRFFTPWHYGRIRMVWEGRWLSIQPVGRG